MGRTHGAGHHVARLQAVALDLLRADVDIVGRRQVVVVAGAQESVAVLQYLQHTIACDEVGKVELLTTARRVIVVAVSGHHRLWGSLCHRTVEDVECRDGSTVLNRQVDNGDEVGTVARVALPNAIGCRGGLLVVLGHLLLQLVQQFGGYGLLLLSGSGLRLCSLRDGCGSFRLGRLFLCFSLCSSLGLQLLLRLAAALLGGRLLFRSLHLWCFLLSLTVLRGFFCCGSLFGSLLFGSFLLGKEGVQRFLLLGFGRLGVQILAVATIYGVNLVGVLGNAGTLALRGSNPGGRILGSLVKDGVNHRFQFVVLRHLHAQFIGYLHQFRDREFC